MPLKDIAPTRLRRRHLAVVVVLALFAPDRVSAQTATAAAVTSAFLYNFAKFTQWPPDTLAPGQRIALCVIGDSAVAEALEQTIKGHTIESHELTVEVVTPDSLLRSCHLLYVSGLDDKRSTQLIQTLKSAPVFTASDGSLFAERGGIAQLILDHGRMRFAINVGAAQQARLQISSKLLSLAQIVREDPHVPH